ncbi:Retrovirus-related Pol polyprotein from type-1 retrotransposable element R1 [Araneus ventricosus]|uniref:Retrovirus-related Pol polyprotein from type-1 retrotransposable element R1 n=1 Tax=Araneus ventricosus TaxID=182803 RepID=A0A4Y2UFN4_ARAVE|nr:Retrovirus-related Pol polyprotein from type-1 retrotransposable element R1 [Araneus ventricosus]
MKVYSGSNAVGVVIRVRGKNILVISCYGPPKENINELLEELDECLTFTHDHLLLTGDFNAKSPLWGGSIEDERGRQLLEFILSKGLAVVNEEDSPPTFDGGRGMSWVDITFSDPCLLQDIFKWQVDAEPSCSDHHSISFSLFNTHSPSRATRRFRLNYINLAKLRTLLQEKLGSKALDIGADLDQKVESLTNIITAACRDSAEKKPKITKKQVWWDRNLEILRSHVRRAKRRLFKAKHQEDRKFLRSRLNKIEGEYKFKLTRAKRDGWSETCSQITEKEPFGVHFDVAKNPDRRYFQLSAIEKADGTLTQTTTEALNELLTYHFPTDDLSDSLTQACIRNLCRVPPPTPDDLPFSPAEVEQAARSINSKKAPGPDGLYGDVIKEAFNSNRSLFTDLFNGCLRQGHFPKKWKTANLVLFNKKNKADRDPAAFRPICLLDAMGKILDKLVTQRIFFHLLRSNLLSANQFGFTPGRSATDALLQLKRWIASARSRDYHSVIISLDVKSAFSRVWWPLVLHNLKLKNCPRNLFSIISSFLSDRWISFSYGNSSLHHGYNVGCPQGSNSGPLLWLLVVDEALNISFDQSTKALAYADDIYLFVEASGKHTIKTQVQEALYLLDRWSKKAKVSFAHEKTQLIPFGKKGYQKHPRTARLMANQLS